MSWDQFHVCWPTWDSNEFRFHFYAKEWPYKNQTYDFFPPIGKKRVQFKLLEQHCVGRLQGGNFQPCEHVEETSEFQCSRCESKQVTTSCAPCNGLKCINPEARETYCENPFVCYLAGFLPARIKVGVALEHRFIRRVFEQGADIATILTIEPNGMKAKKLEHNISKMGVTERLRKDEKVSGLYSGSTQKLLKEFSRIRTHITEKFNLQSQDNIYKLYKRAKYPRLNKKPFKLDLQKEKYVSGKIIGVKGPWMVLKERSSHYILNVWDLAGWVIKKTNRRMKVQALLSEFNH